MCKECILEDLELKLKLTNETQKRLINWFAKQNKEMKLKIFDLKRNQFFKLKQELNENIEVVDYMSLILAIKDIHDKLEYQNKKNKNKTLSEITDITNLQLLSLEKESIKEKYEAIVNRYSVIEKLREKNLSWRKISNVFKSRYRVDISHTYLKNVYEKIEDAL